MGCCKSVNKSKSVNSCGSNNMRYISRDDMANQINRDFEEKEDSKNTNIQYNMSSNQVININTIASIEANEIFAVLYINQNLKNPFDYPIELELIIPTIKDLQLIKFEVKIEDKVIILTVLKTDKAEEKYTDSIAQGNTAVISSYDSSTSGQVINIGNLNKGEEVRILATYAQMMNSSDMSYELLTIQKYPSFIIKSEKSCKFINNIKGTINLSCHSKITRLSLKNKMQNYVFNKEIKNSNCATITFMNENGEIKEKFSSVNQVPLSVLFRTVDMNIPKAIVQYSKDNNEYTYILNYLYMDSNSNNLNISSDIDTDDDVDFYKKYQSDKINSMPSLFVFLLDQSGSMSGNRIELVKKAMKLFLKSLPIKSYYQIIWFGSDFEKYNEKPVEYTEKNVEESIEIINNLRADKGGTNIFDPLQEIIIEDKNVYENINLSKNIFILTDGEVENKEKCLDIIREKNENFRIYALGIGNSFDRELIDQCGRLGKGDSLFIYDESTISSVVIDKVNICLRKYITNIKLNNIENVKFEYPKEIKVVYQDDIILYGFISEKNLDSLNLNFTYSTNEEKSKKINLINIVRIEDGDILNKIVIGNYLKKLSDEKEEVDLAIKYKILSKHTTLFGKLLRNNNITDELIKVKYIENFSNQKSFFFTVLDEEIETIPESTLCYVSCSVIKKKKIERYYEMEEPNRKMKKKKYDTNSNSNNNNYYSKYNKSNEINVMDIIMMQDTIEGSWNYNVRIYDFITKNNEAKKILKKISKFVDGKFNDKIKNKIIYTFIVIYYIKNFESSKINELKLIINKGIEFLKLNNLTYDQLVNDFKN